MLRHTYCTELIVKIQNVNCSSNHHNNSKTEGEDGGTMTSGKFCDSKCLSLLNRSVRLQGLEWFYIFSSEVRKNIHISLFQMCKSKETEEKKCCI